MEQSQIEAVLNALARITHGKTLVFSGKDLFINGEFAGTTDNVAEVLTRHVKA